MDKEFYEAAVARERARIRRIRKIIVIGVCAILAFVLCANTIGVVPYNHTGVLRGAEFLQSDECN